MGRAFSDVPYAEDRAHRDVECSGRGICTSFGTCNCDVGFTVGTYSNVLVLEFLFFILVS